MAQGASVGVVGAVGYGFTGTFQQCFADAPGQRRIEVATDVFGHALDETNAAVTCREPMGGWEVRAGFFQLRHYDTFGHSIMGEPLGAARVFAGRSLGGMLGASHPLGRHRRLDFELLQVRVERPDAVGHGLVTSPSVSLVGDAVIHGRTGPVGGGRCELTFSPSLAWFPDGLAYRNVALDARGYRGLRRGYTLAGRVLAGRSDGRDAPAFRVGGFSTLRGVPLYGLGGTRMAVASGELRFPFIERLEMLGPVPLGRLAVRGALFADAGMVWDRGTPLRLTRSFGGERRLDSPRLAFGAGARTTLASLVLRLDVAWPTDLARVRSPDWTFGIGPEF